MSKEIVVTHSVHVNNDREGSVNRHCCTGCLFTIFQSFCRILRLQILVVSTKIFKD